MEEVRALQTPADTAASRPETTAPVEGQFPSVGPRPEARLRPETYPGEWRELRRAARRRHLRRDLIGWSAVVMMLAVSACTTTVAVTAGGLVGYAGYSIYRLAEAGRSWTAATYEFLFTARKSDPVQPGEAQKQGSPACSWSDRLRSRC